jgi:hypothetical protein
MREVAAKRKNPPTANRSRKRPGGVAAEGPQASGSPHIRGKQRTALSIRADRSSSEGSKRSTDSALK